MPFAVTWSEAAAKLLLEAGHGTLFYLIVASKPADNTGLAWQMLALASAWPRTNELLEACQSVPSFWSSLVGAQ